MHTHIVFYIHRCKCTIGNWFTHVQNNRYITPVQCMRLHACADSIYVKKNYLCTHVLVCTYGQINYTIISSFFFKINHKSAEDVIISLNYHLFISRFFKLCYPGRKHANLNVFDSLATLRATNECVNIWCLCEFGAF